MKRLGLLFLMGYVASGGVAQAATYYVSKAGSNGNSCAAAQSISTPKLTVNAGIGCLAAGDTLLVRQGTYNEGITGGLASGTSWSNKVRIAAYSGETVTMRPLSNAVSGGRVILLDGNFQYIEFDGIDFDGSLLSGTETTIWVSTNNLNNPHHIRIKNAEIIAGAIGSGAAIALGSSNRVVGSPGGNEVQNVVIHGGGLSGNCGFACNSYGIYIAGPNNLVEDVEIYDTSAACIQIYAGSGDAANNNIIRRMYCHDVTRHGDPSQLWGIIVAGSSNLIYNNVFDTIKDGTLGDGINLFFGSNNTFYNNTIYNVGKYGMNLSADGSGTQVKNNIVYMTGSTAYVNGASGTVQSNNLFGTNPQFVNPSAKNFQLQAASPAINSGAVLAVVTTDFAGVARPQGSAPDIGAHEYRSQQGPVPPTGVRIVTN